MAKKVSSSLPTVGNARRERKVGSLDRSRKRLSVYSPNWVGMLSRVKYPARTRRANPSVRALLGASRWVWILRSRYFMIYHYPSPFRRGVGVRSILLFSFSQVFGLFRLKRIQG